DLARIDLLLVMRMYRVGSTYGPIARRVVTVHRIVPDVAGSPRLVRLIEWVPDRDAFDHDENAELELLCLRRGGDLEGLRAELERREADLRSVAERGVVGIPDVRRALAAFRGKDPPTIRRGDP